MAEFAIFRCAKLKRGRGAGTLSQSLRHLERHSESAEISHPELTKFNRSDVSRNFDLSKITKKIIERHNKNSKRALRKDASLAAELLFSYSQTDERGKPLRPFDLHFVEEYEKRIVDFIKKEFPNFVPVRLDRHCDESSVHWHVVGFCFADKEHRQISTKSVLGGPEDMKKHQDKFAAAVADLGLERGLPKSITKSKHKTKREWNRRKLAEQERQKQKAIEEGQKAADEIFR